MLLSAQAGLTEQCRQINELNVFPVPDGDTGTNMSLTMKAAGDEFARRTFTTLGAAAECAASCLLRGARGNSGVILSLLFRGISKRFKGLETAGTAEFAGALADGVEAAYKAVMKPAEGTILTVSRLASKAAVEAAELGADIEGVFICAIKAGTAALEETKEINPVLRKAGVVDAGGKGYMVILESMLAALRGEAVISSAEIPEEEENVFGVFDTEEITFAYDTVFIVRTLRDDSDILPFRAYLSGMGDSLVISEGEKEFKVHVHTNEPGAVITEASKYGVLEVAKIENMRSQHEAVAAGQKARSTDDLEEDASQAPATPEKEIGAVAVCAGEGMEAIFRELGADGIITGGQTMNPSTDDILREINKTPASTVFVFPNNKNIIMAAEQCVSLTEKKVIVMPTKTIPQGITALLNFSPDDDADTNLEQMADAVKNVHTAQVTYAARDSDFDGHTIRAGEYLALIDGALLGSFTSVPELFAKLADALKEFAPEFITVYYGADVTEADAGEVEAALSGAYPDAEVRAMSGGQPVYYYIISVE